MISFDAPSTIFITCHKRLSPYLEREVREAGFMIDQVHVTGVQLTGSLNDCIRLNLRLRCASQVLYSMMKFTAENADHVYEEVLKKDWENIISGEAYFSVTSTVDNPTINNNLFANLRVKDAIVDRFRKVGNMRPDSGAVLKGTVIHLHWKNDNAELFLDTSGDSLARHGYRKAPGRAPMLEALAAATIMATNWNHRSPFINPMCGSGTLAIEAALIATKTAPGLFRSNFAFMHIAGYDEELYLSERGKLENAIEVPDGLRIIATDYSSQAIANARKNAHAAGVDDLIEFSVCDFYDTPVPEDGGGVMLINPEYGERLGDVQELTETYSRIGDFMKKRCKGYTGYVFTGNLELGKKIGLKPSRKVEFYTSTIDCRLFEYELYSGSRR